MMFKARSTKLCAFGLLIFCSLAVLSTAQLTNNTLCPLHETYNCGSACQTECATLGQPCPIINLRCQDGCYCDEGYARDTTGACIPLELCLAK